MCPFRYSANSNLIPAAVIARPSVVIGVSVNERMFGSFVFGSFGSSTMLITRPMACVKRSMLFVTPSRLHVLLHSPSARMSASKPMAATPSGTASPAARAKLVSRSDTCSWLH